MLSAGANLLVGHSDYSAGTPVAINLSTGTLSARSLLSAYSLGSLTTLDGLSVTSGQSFIFAARGSIVLSSGRLISSGSLLALLADTDANGLGDVNVSASMVINVSSDLCRVDSHVQPIDPREQIIAFGRQINLLP